MNKKCIFGNCLTNNEKFISSMKTKSSKINISSYKLINDIELKILQDSGLKVQKNKIISICSCHLNLNLMFIQAYEIYESYSNNKEINLIKTIHVDKELILCKI